MLNGYKTRPRSGKGTKASQRELLQTPQMLPCADTSRAQPILRTLAMDNQVKEMVDTPQEGPPVALFMHCYSLSIPY